MTTIATNLLPNAAKVLDQTQAQPIAAPKANLLSKVLIEVQALSKDVPAPAPKKDAAMEKMVELLNQILSNAVKVEGENLPAWTGVKIKSKGYLIYMDIPGPKRLKFVKDAAGKWNVATKDGVQLYRRLSGTRLPLMNGKDFIALNKHNHEQSLKQIERTYMALPFAKAMLDVILNRSGELHAEVQSRLGIK